MDTSDRDRAGPILVYGFGITVAVWAVGYVCRLPLVLAPPELLAPLLVLVVPVGGYLAARATGRLGHIGLAESAWMLAEVLGLGPEAEIEETLAPVIATGAVSTEFLDVAPGRVAGIDQTLSLVVDGRRPVRMELQMYVGAESPRDAVSIEGVPPLELEITSAHRTPERTVRIIRDAEERGVRVFIIGAGSAAHLAGVVAAHTVRPVLGVPLSASDLKGVDALYATVMMPAGIPVGTLAIGRAPIFGS